MRENKKLCEVFLRNGVLFFALAIALAFAAAAAPPDGVTADSYSAAEMVQSYAGAWQRFFRSPPPLPRDLDLSGVPSREEAFSRLWGFCEPALLPSERPAALAALRLRVLGDELPTLEGLDRLIRRGRLVQEDLGGALLYRFLDETVTDPAFLPEVLPPAATPMKLHGALKIRGVSQSDFEARFLAWALSSAAGAGLLSGVPLDLPSVWALDGGIHAGGFALTAVPLSLEGSNVGLEIAGDLDPRLRLLTVQSAADGRVVGTALAPLPPVKSVLAGNGDRLWVAVINPGNSLAALGGLALTFWKSWNPAVEVRESRLERDACDLLLDEAEGMANYRLWSAPSGEDASRSLSEEFPSEGPGLHRYRVLLTGDIPSSEASLRLVGRALTGAEVVVDLQPIREAPRSQPAP